jgi:hypothetical protein
MNMIRSFPWRLLQRPMSRGFRLWTRHLVIDTTRLPPESLLNNIPGRLYWECNPLPMSITKNTQDRLHSNLGDTPARHANSALRNAHWLVQIINIRPLLFSRRLWWISSGLSSVPGLDSWACSLSALVKCYALAKSWHWIKCFAPPAHLFFAVCASF